MAYITRADVTNLLNLTNLSVTAESALDAIIVGVEAAAGAFGNRTFNIVAQQTESFDSGTDTFFPAHVPMASVASITIDGDAVDLSEISLYDSYVRLGFYAPCGRQSVEITYTPAESLPGSVKLALIQWAAQLFKAAEDGGKITERARVGEVEPTFKTRDGMPTFVEQVLSRYRLYPL